GDDLRTARRRSGAAGESRWGPSPGRTGGRTMTSDARPHTRWLIRESIDRLAASYDAVTVAVDALTRSAVLRSSAGDGPTIRQRITGGRGWARTVWFGVATLLTGLFMAWISVRLVRHLSVAPGIVPVLPGLLLALGL